MNTSYRTMMVVTKVRIDKLGHANFAQQQLMALDALEEYRIKIGIGIDELQSKYGMHLVLRKCEVKYRGELFENDEVCIEILLSCKKDKLLVCEAKISKDSCVKTYLKWTMALISVRDKSTMETPTWMRALIQQPVPQTT